MKKWHLYGVLGMMPFGIPTDPALPEFMERAAKELGLEIHGPVRDYKSGEIAAEVDELPADEGAFSVGTSLGANDQFYISSYLRKRKLQGVFMFQCSSYGPHSVGNNGTEFAHLIYSYNPIPLPGLGSYIPPEGPLTVKNYVRTPIHLPHPGDYDLVSQELFIADMRRIIKEHADGKPAGS